MTGGKPCDVALSGELSPHRRRRSQGATWHLGKAGMPMPRKAPMFCISDPAASASPSYEVRRGTARERGYTRGWDRASATYRATHPLCVGCSARGRTVACDVVDHIIPHKGDYVLFWDEGNWQSACHWCHSVVKQELERQYAARLIDSNALRLSSAAAIALASRLGG